MARSCAWCQRFLSSLGQAPVARDREKSLSPSLRVVVRAHQKYREHRVALAVLFRNINILFRNLTRRFFLYGRSSGPGGNPI